MQKTEFIFHVSRVFFDFLWLTILDAGKIVGLRDQYSALRPDRSTPVKTITGKYCVRGCVDPIACLEIIQKRKISVSNCIIIKLVSSRIGKWKVLSVSYGSYVLLKNMM